MAKYTLPFFACSTEIIENGKLRRLYCSRIIPTTRHPRKRVLPHWGVIQNEKTKLLR